MVGMEIVKIEYFIMKQTIEIEVPEGFIAKWNKEEKQLEIIEKDRVPTTWEEYKNIIKDKKSYYVNVFEKTVESTFTPCFYEFQSKETAEAFVALGKLIQLRDEWWRQLNWKSDWDNCMENKYLISNHKCEIITDCLTTANRILAFPTKEMRDKFLTCFEELIETAKPLL